MYSYVGIGKYLNFLFLHILLLPNLPSIVFSLVSGAVMRKKKCQKMSFFITKLLYSAP